MNISTTAKKFIPFYYILLLFSCTKKTGNSAQSSLVTSCPRLDSASSSNESETCKNLDCKKSSIINVFDSNKSRKNFSEDESL
jgi:hypothetical protein